MRFLVKFSDFLPQITQICVLQTLEEKRSLLGT